MNIPQNLTEGGLNLYKVEFETTGGYKAVTKIHSVSAQNAADRVFRNIVDCISILGVVKEK